MRRITQYDELSQIISINKSKESNYYFMKDKITTLIEKGKISVDYYGANTYIYEDCDSFYRMYYFIDGNLDTLGIEVDDKDIVVEIPFNKSLNDHQLLQEKILKKNSFVLERESSQMSVNTKDVLLQSVNLDQKLSFKYGNKNECDRYIEMLYSIFNPLFAFLPSKQELLGLIDNKCIICAYYDDKLVGLLNIELENNNAWLRHILVSTDFRGNNIGKFLLQEGYKSLIYDCKKIKCWVDIHNIPAIKLYEKFGNKLNDRKANEYVRRNSISQGKRYGTKCY